MKMKMYGFRTPESNFSVSLSHIMLLSKCSLMDFTDKAAADELEEQLTEAERVLGDYVKRLEEEKKERKDLQELLEAFVWQQKQQLRECRKKLKVWPAARALLGRGGFNRPGSSS